MAPEQNARRGILPPPTGPRAYLITFTGYGTWLHGDAAGSVDRQHNVYGLPVCKPDPGREGFLKSKMEHDPFIMDGSSRATVLAAIREVCEQRAWWLFAAHVRMNHVHVVVQAGDPPERVMNDFKVYASRHLNRSGSGDSTRKRWSRHGSTRHLWNQEQLERAIHYVLYGQGEAMAVYAGPGVCKECTAPLSESEPRA